MKRPMQGVDHQSKPMTEAIYDLPPSADPTPAGPTPPADEPKPTATFSEPADEPAFVAEGTITAETEAEPIGEAREFFDDTGRRFRTFISTKDFIPGNRDNLLRFLLDVPAGYVEWLGSVSGWITSTEDKTNKVKDERGEREIKSICLVGDFRAERADHNGELEVLRSARLYLPNAFGEAVKTAFALAGVESVELDCEVGVVKVTRGAIPFEWTVRSYGADPAEARHQAIQARQRARLARRQERLALGRGQSSAKVIDMPVAGKDKPA